MANPASLALPKLDTLGVSCQRDFVGHLYLEHLASFGLPMLCFVINSSSFDIQLDTIRARLTSAPT